MSKPRGGRGYKAPYETHQVRVPDPITPQVHSLIERYQDYLAAGNNAENPPLLLDQNKSDQNNVVNLILEKKNRAEEILKQALKLKPNAGGAIKKEIEKALILLEL